MGSLTMMLVAAGALALIRPSEAFYSYCDCEMSLDLLSSKLMQLKWQEQYAKEKLESTKEELNSLKEYADGTRVGPTGIQNRVLKKIRRTLVRGLRIGTRDLRRLYAGFNNFPWPAKMSLAMMNIEIGTQEMMEFNALKDAVENHNWNRAADLMENSRWFVYHQNKERLRTLIDKMREANDYTPMTTTTTTTTTPEPFVDIVVGTTPGCSCDASVTHLQGEVNLVGHAIQETWQCITELRALIAELRKLIYGANRTGLSDAELEAFLELFYLEVEQAVLNLKEWCPEFTAWCPRVQAALVSVSHEMGSCEENTTALVTALHSKSWMRVAILLENMVWFRNGYNKYRLEYILQHIIDMDDCREMSEQQLTAVQQMFVRAYPLQLTVYKDSRNRTRCGTGHFVTNKDSEWGSPYGTEISMQRAHQLMNMDINRALVRCERWSIVFDCFPIEVKAVLIILMHSVGLGSPRHTSGIYQFEGLQDACEHNDFSKIEQLLKSCQFCKDENDLCEAICAIIGPVIDAH